MLILSLVALLGQPTSTQPQQPAGDQAVQTAKKEDRVVCHRERVIGSRVASRRICMTVRERDRATTTTQREMGELIQRSHSGAATPN